MTVHGSNQNEDGIFSWKYDNYTCNFAPGGPSELETVQLWQRTTYPVLIINASHWTYHDRPQQVIALMQDFLQRHIRAAGNPAD